MTRVGSQRHSKKKIVLVIVRKDVHVNMCLILNGCRNRAV